MGQLRGTGGISALVVLAWAVGCGPGQSGDDGSTGGSSSGGSSSSGDSSTGDPPQASLLELCDAPAPCDAFALDPGSNGENVDPDLECALGEVLGSLADGTAVELTSSYCDIGCTGTDLLFVGDGTLYRQYWTTTAATEFDAIERCTPRPASYFEPCVGQPWAPGGCSNWGDWTMDCEPVDTVTCP